MALTKCNECGNEVSTKAKTCPKCGAKVKPKGISLLGWIGIIFGAVIFLPMLARCAGDAPVSSITSSSPTAAPKLSPQEEAMAAVSIKKLNWYKGGFDNVMLVDVTFENKGKRDVKDIELKCTHYSNSDTKIDSNTKTIYEVVAAGKSRQIKKFSMGFIHTQAAKTNCEISDLVVM